MEGVVLGENGKNWKDWVRRAVKNEGFGVPLVLHIGMEKTGSKSIQNWMSEKRDELVNEGWWVPRKLGQINHRLISYLGFSNKKRDDGTERRGIYTRRQMRHFKKGIIEKIKEEIADCKNNKCRGIIASTELISSRLITQKEINRLCKNLRNIGIGEILIVLYRRNPIDLIESKHSTAIEFEGRTQRHPARPGDFQVELFGQQKKLQDTWEQCCRKIEGMDLEVLHYENNALPYGSAVYLFASLLGCSKKLVETSRNIRSNSRIPIVTLTAMRYVNKLLKSTNDQSKQRTLLGLKRNIRERFLIFKSWKYRLPKSLRKEYETAYLDSILDRETGEWLIKRTWI